MLHSTLTGRLRLALFSVLAGAAAGVAATVFLYLLAAATAVREANPAWLLTLPPAGFLVGWLYWRYGGRVGFGHNLILEEIHDPKETIPFRMAPFVLLGTVLTHLGGGSAGREGTSVQMGASLADQLARLFRLGPAERRALLVAGTGAGFGAAIGAPLAGAIFGAEVLGTGRLRAPYWMESALASFTGFYVSRLLHAPHTEYPPLVDATYASSVLALTLVVGLGAGLAARFFVAVTHRVEAAQARLFSYPPLRPLVGGLFLLALFALPGALRYAGLGLPVITEALREPAFWWDPFAKLGFTALTIGSGFKGGEFIPLVFIGTPLGSALGAAAGAPISLLASVGYAAAFAGAANTPLACTIMAAELFGASALPFAALACYASYFVSGAPGIYRGQRQYRPKHHLFFRLSTALRLRR